MKIWFGHGSEHSANLVMIGHFETPADAQKAFEVVQKITDQARLDSDSGLLNLGELTRKYGDAMLDLLGKVNVAAVAPHELEQFLLEVDVRVEGSDVIIKTEEFDVSAFLKVFVGRGAKVEIYSAHDYPNTGYGRGA